VFNTSPEPGRKGASSGRLGLERIHRFHPCANPRRLTAMACSHLASKVSLSACPCLFKAASPNLLPVRIVDLSAAWGPAGLPGRPAHQLQGRDSADPPPAGTEHSVGPVAGRARSLTPNPSPVTLTRQSKQCTEHALRRVRGLPAWWKARGDLGGCRPAMWCCASARWRSGQSTSGRTAWRAPTTR